ncbi:MAG TPA: GNAT family N-acetyltransferase [Mycobacteriales bacterium]|nr:GNAT family N-acetyltransferase [Mycobacteriales bacterium]
MQIRPARLDDVPELLDLVHSAYRGDASRAGWTTEADLIDGSRTDADELTALVPDLLVAVDGEALVGCCALTARGDTGYFGTFAVRPLQQGSGVGSALLAAAEERARAQGLRAVEMTVLSARPELIAYYERRGYADTGRSVPFPYGVERNGRPRRDDLEFALLQKPLHAG